jgi:Haemolymph juvenile hormone binding protein (JHBP)
MENYVGLAAGGYFLKENSSSESFLHQRGSKVARAKNKSLPEDNIFFTFNAKNVLKDNDHISASTIKVCSRNDPNVAKCILDSVRDLQPRLASGVLAPDFRIPVRKTSIE